MARAVLLKLSVCGNHLQFSSAQFTQSCLTLCNPMDCSTQGFPVHHQLPEHLGKANTEITSKNKYYFFFFKIHQTQFGWPTSGKVSSSRSLGWRKCSQPMVSRSRSWVMGSLQDLQSDRSQCGPASEGTENCAF